MIGKKRQGEVVYKHQHIVNISLVTMGKIELFKGKASDNHIQVISKILENLHIKIASPALDRILDIILDNAIKHNIPRGTILINLESDSKAVILTVRNTGPGIPAEKIKHIFKPQKQSTSGECLPWVKNILIDISGNITIESSMDNETTVTITFKREITKKEKRYRFLEQTESREPVKEQELRLKPESHDDKKKTILVLEKDTELLAFMQKNMEEDFNFYYIRDFSKINQKLEKLPKPNVIIINMTDRDYSLCELVQEKWVNQDILFVFYTAKAEQRELLKGLRYGGAVDYIDKPCSIKVLNTKIQSILRYREKSIMRRMEKVKENIIKAIKLDKKDDGTFITRIELFNLTKREQEVVECIVKDMDDKEIAEKLGISEDAVKILIKNIQERCGLQTRFQIMKFFQG